MSGVVRTAPTPVLPAPRPARAAFALVAALLLLGVALVLWAPAGAFDEHAPFAQLTAFRVQLAGAGLLVAALLLLVPRRPVRVLGAALLVVAASPLPQVLPRVVADGPTARPDLTVVSINVFLNRMSPRVVADLAVSRRADVVALPEATASFAAEVVALAGRSGVEYRAATDGDTAPPRRDGRRQGPYPTSLLVRADLRPVFRAGAPALPQGAVTADLPGPLAVAAVHPLAPVPGQEPAWAADHKMLARACATGGPLVLAGDFNATLDHSPLRGILAAGCVDAAEATGAGLRGTWPASAAWPLRVPIDHVLLTPAAGTVAGYDVVELPGTDHRGLIVGIASPA